jgi:general secretion pathway protein E
MSTKPRPEPAPSSSKPEGRLEWRRLLRWLLKDGLIDEAQAVRTEQRLGAGDSSLHPLVRLGHASLVHLATGKPLDVDALSEWLAVRAKMPYLRIDPLKVDVGRVGDVMSIGYAEAKRCLPVQFGLTDVTIATSEPFDTGWDRALHDRVLHAGALRAPGGQGRRAKPSGQLRATCRAGQDEQAARRQ